MPSLPTGTTTRFGTVWPASKLRFEVVGRVPPPGKAVTCPGLAALVTVTFRATAVTPAGILPLPAIFTLAEEYALTMPIGAPVPVRVSRRRVGVYGVKSEPTVDSGSSLTTSAWFAASVTVTLTLYSPSSA